MFEPDAILTIKNANDILNIGLQAIFLGQTVINLHHLTHVDSTAIAVLIAWKREALKQGQILQFKNISSNLKKLAMLYDVVELLDITNHVS